MKGSYGNKVLFDDAGLTLFRINEDGSLGDICDILITPLSGGLGSNSRIDVDKKTGRFQLIEVISRQHSIVANPSSEIFALCDKGMDRIYTYRLDRDKGKIVPLDEFDAEVGCFPRYGVFHPSLPMYYANNETEATLNSFHYDETTGKLDRFSYKTLLLEDSDGRKQGSQDILVHPNGKALYVSLSGDFNYLATLRLNEKGIPSLVQNIPCGGIFPRGIAISPDERFLLSGNIRSGNITTFRILPDYTLESTGMIYDAVSPSAIRFYVS
ncbi:MAG: lactonase family protein [Clostridiales bacterium]|nr:lactonase family protein [Clostridiales bacterium]